MTPWGIPAPDQFRPVGPPALGSELYLEEFMEVKRMGSVTSEFRTADETDILRVLAYDNRNLLLEPCGH